MEHPKHHENAKYYDEIFEIVDPLTRRFIAALLVRAYMDISGCYDTSARDKGIAWCKKSAIKFWNKPQVREYLELLGLGHKFKHKAMDKVELEYLIRCHARCY